MRVRLVAALSVLSVLSAWPEVSQAQPAGGGHLIIASYCQLALVVVIVVVVVVVAAVQ